MRKYFKIERTRPVEKRLCGLQADSNAWGLLSAFVQGTALCLPFDELSALISVLNRRSVGDYLERGDYFLSAHSLYADMSISSIRSSRQAWSLLRKYPWSRESYDVDRRQVAFNKLLACEETCRNTNVRLRDPLTGVVPPFIWRARYLIARLLGDCRSQIMEMLSLAGPGKGSTVSNKRDRVTQYYKYHDLPYTCSRGALPYALAAISSDPHWMEILENSGRRKSVPLDLWPHGQRSRAQSEKDLFFDCVDIADDDSVTFVPKDAKTERPIAIGASLNVMLQLGVNAHLTTLLRGVGVDLRDQSRNQTFAFLGSKFHQDNQGESPCQFSTIDLASASDTISTELVKLLLPSDWFAFLSDLRHESGVLDGQPMQYEKFAAMGNGFTFPLESLIFWAVSKAAIEVSGSKCRIDDIAVYGDDIIIRYRESATVVQALEYCGFAVNTSKSFYSGAFKESCGSDYWGGHNVRPIYLKRSLDEIGAYYYIANTCARVIHSSHHSVGHYNMYEYAVRNIPKQNRRYGPLGPIVDTSDSDLYHLGVSEDYLQVPLRALSHPGIRPWCSEEELRYLIKINAFDNDIDGRRKTPRIPDPSVPMAVFYTLRPKSFSGKGSIKYYLALRNKRLSVPHLFEWDNLDIEHLRCAASGVITRRGRNEWLTVAVPIHNWNGALPKRDIDRHPSLMMDLGA